VRWVASMEATVTMRRDSVALRFTRTCGRIDATADSATIETPRFLGSASTCSMSRRGDCYDNAAMESWFSTVKSELGEKYERAARAVFAA
jgi:hypothetical protein